jgi:MFS superfamily sulfate permease-like transporter
MDRVTRVSFRTFIAECGGSCGDLGTFLPHVIGAITVGGLAPFGVLFAFAVFLIGSGWFYRIPMAVQPMKAVSAVILTAGLTPGEVAAAGVMLGLLLLVFGVSGLIARVARLIPQSVSIGLQFGLGLLMGVLGLKLILAGPIIGIVALIMLLLVMRVPNCPAAPVTLAASALIGWALGTASFPEVAMTIGVPQIVVPAWSDFWRAFGIAVVPQLALTLTNAVIMTAALSRDLFPRATAVSERNLAITSGLANIVLSPFGAMPMCHGAGGLQAQYRFGGRTGVAPVILGVALLVLAIAFSTSAVKVLQVIPVGAVGALLILAGTDLALSRRLIDAKPSCRPVIGVAALLTLLVNPAVGLLFGWLAEIIRAAIMRKFVFRDLS